MPYAIVNAIDQYTAAGNVSLENDNPCVILTKDCLVQFMDNMVVSGYTAGNVLATLPENYKPVSPVTFLVPVLYEGDRTYEHMTLTTDGTLTLPHTYATEFTIFLNGVNVNVCGTYYTNEIGNNANVGTSPIDEE